METHIVDLPAEQIVRWLIEHLPHAKREFEIAATRSYVRGEISAADARRRRIGDEEMEDLSDVTAVGVLEVTPLHKKDGWVLRIRVEDQLGKRLPEDEPIPNESEDIDLTAFRDQFIVPGSGVAFVSVEAETSKAWASCRSLLADIERDFHER